MKTPLYKRYESRRPCGAVQLSNWFGLVLFEPTEEDRYNADFIAAWSNGGELRGFHRHQLHETSGGRFYLRKGSQRFYMDEITRI